MSQETMKEKYVTQAVFSRAIEKIDARFDRIEKTMLTKDDLKNFNTKDDLKNFATKDDLKNFVTKDDSKNFATKDDIKNMATKDDIGRLAVAIQRHDRMFEEIKETMATKSAVNSIQNQLDHIVGLIQDFSRKAFIHDHRFNVLEPVVADHEKRLIALEARQR